MGEVDRARQNRSTIFGFGSVAALAIGSLGPWVTVTLFGLTVSKSGVDGDGVFTLVIAALAAIFLYWQTRDSSRSGLFLVLLLGLLALAVSVYDVIDVSSRRLVSPGWGLYLAAVASIGIAAAGVMRIQERRS